jgi:aspartate aminotransferase
MKLSARVQKLQPSATLTITAKAKALKSQGVDVIGFGAGEPDFDSPDHVKEAAIRAINEGMTKYTGVGGIDELKDAIIHRLKEDHNLEYEKSEIIVSVGAKHTLYNIMQVLFESGDEVIVPAPYWVSYPEQIRLAEATPVILDTKESEGFKVTPDQLRAHINSNTKALILNYPSNPTGATYNEQELRAIVDVAMDAGLIIISDEIYEKIIYNGIKHVPVASLGEDIKKSTILVNGVSKTYSMTGWRIGYAAGDKGVISAMSKLQGQSTSNPTSISQWAAIAAFMGSHQVIEDRTKEFEQRKNYIVEKLNDIPEINCFDPQGAFYVFPNISGYFGKEYDGKVIKDSLDFTEFILDEAKVAVVPGVAFGSDDHVRISYATSMDDIVKGMERITEAVKKLS